MSLNSSVRVSTVLYVTTQEGSVTVLAVVSCELVEAVVTYESYSSILTTKEPVIEEISLEEYSTELTV